MNLQDDGAQEGTSPTQNNDSQIEISDPSSAPPQRREEIVPDDKALQQSARSASATLLGNVRINGFEQPWGRDQVLSCLGHSVSACCFYVAVGLILSDAHIQHLEEIRLLTTIIMAIHTPAVVVLVIAWISCEQIDPSRSVEEVLPRGWFGMKLSGKRWRKTRYCAVCRKSVPGLDHHCTWLQTCIGVANYVQFFAIACSGAVQFITQTIFGALCVFWLHLPLTYEGKSPSSVEVLLLVTLVISVPCVIMYSVLLSFHVSLYFLGYGTYEWMLRRRRKQKAARSQSARTSGDHVKRDPKRALSTGGIETQQSLGDDRDYDGRRMGERAVSAPHRQVLAPPNEPTAL